MAQRRRLRALSSALCASPAVLRRTCRGLLTFGSRRMRSAWIEAASCCACDQVNKAKSRQRRVEGGKESWWSRPERCEPSLTPPHRSIWRSAHERLLGKLAGPLRRAERGTRKLDGPFVGRFRLQVKTWVCLREGRLELTVQIVRTAGYARTPRSRDAAPQRCGNRHRREGLQTGGAAGNGSGFQKAS